MATSENVKQWRERRSYGQAELARLVGVTPNAIYRIEKGTREPRPETLRKIADVLKVDVAILKGLDTGNAAPRPKPAV